MRIGPLYHWSRKKHRRSILREGLKLMEPCSDGTPAEFPWICLGSSPSAAWGLYPPRMNGLTEEIFDLWQVNLDEGDEIYVRGDLGPRIMEVRVLNGLPADRVWWVGERMLHSHDSLES